MNVNPYNTTDYEEKSNWTPGENKPNSKPISKTDYRRQTTDDSLSGVAKAETESLPAVGGTGDRKKGTENRVRSMLPKLLNFHVKNSLTARVNSLKYSFLVITESFVMKSFIAKKNEVEQKWLLVDADGAILGRMASKIAPILMGKNKPTYTPHVDTGDYVVVVNAKKIQLTGNKAKTKQYDYYTHHPGGHKFVSFADMIAKKPERVIELAVKRMLPKNKLGRKMLKKLKVYRGPEHENQAQKPEKIELF